MGGRRPLARDHRELLRRLVAAWHYPAGTGLWVLAFVLLLLGVYPPMVRLPLSAFVLLVALAIASAPPAAPARLSGSRRAWAAGATLLRIAAMMVAVLLIWSFAGEPR
jgi:hypothetical protein